MTLDEALTVERSASGISRRNTALHTLAAEVHALRQRHAEAVRECWREAFFKGMRVHLGDEGVDTAWLASEAKKELG